MAEASTGHNSGVDATRLRSFIERIERLADDRKAIGDDIKDLFLEAKSAGFDPSVMREVLKRRKCDQADLFERDALIDTYMSALTGPKP